MNIEIKCKSHTTFDEIFLGECFVWDDCTYQKVRPSGDTVSRQAVQSSTGIVWEFELSTPVTPVNATLVVEK